MEYRDLKEGEVLKKNDEYWTTIGWEKTRMAGTIVGEHPLHIPNTVTKYRRPLKNNVSKKPTTNKTKVANCHLWEIGKQCEYVSDWVCLDQCCAIPPISNRL